MMDDLDDLGAAHYESEVLDYQLSLFSCLIRVEVGVRTTEVL